MNVTALTQMHDIPNRFVFKASEKWFVVKKKSLNWVSPI
jgi:hypothetical protein